MSTVQSTRGDLRTIGDSRELSLNYAAHDSRYAADRRVINTVTHPTKSNANLQTQKTDIIDLTLDSTLATWTLSFTIKNGVIHKNRDHVDITHAGGDEDQHHRAGLDIRIKAGATRKALKRNVVEFIERDATQRANKCPRLTEPPLTDKKTQAPVYTNAGLTMRPRAWVCLDMNNGTHRSVRQQMANLSLVPKHEKQTTARVTTLTVAERRRRREALRSEMREDQDRSYYRRRIKQNVQLTCGLPAPRRAWRTCVIQRPGQVWSRSYLVPYRHLSSVHDNIFS